MAKEKSKKKLGMTTLIFIGLFLGAFTGIILYYFVPGGYMRDTVLVDGVFYVVGQGFLRLMQMLVVPLVFCSLICGSAAIGDTKTLGKVGVKTIVFYLFYNGSGDFDRPCGGNDCQTGTWTGYSCDSDTGCHCS